MDDLLKTLLTLSLSGGVLTVLLFLLRPALRRAPSLRYYLCLIVLVRLAVPFAPEGSLMNRAFRERPVNGSSVQPVQAGNNNMPVVNAPLPVQPVQTPEAPAVDAPKTPDAVPEALPAARPEAEPGQKFDVGEIVRVHLLYIWAIGALAVLFPAIAGLAAFDWRMKRSARQAGTEQQAALQALCGGRRAPRLMRSVALASPVTMGLFRPRIVLPEREYDAAELEYILRHELTHIRRWDIAYKWFALLVGAAHWFNPLVWLLRREIDVACELSCDAAVAQALDQAGRTDYCRTLLRAAVPNGFPLPRVGLGGGKRAMKERMATIMTHKKASKKKRVLGGLCACAVCVAALMLGCANLPGTKPQDQKAPDTLAAQDIEAAAIQNDIGLDMPEADENEVRELLNRWVEAYESGDFAAQTARMNDAVRAGHPDGGALAEFLEDGKYTVAKCRIVGNGRVEGGVEAELHYMLYTDEPGIYYATEFLGIVKDGDVWEVNFDSATPYYEIGGVGDLDFALSYHAFYYGDFAGTAEIPQFTEAQLERAQQKADAGDMRYTDIETAGANYLHLADGITRVEGDTVYRFWDAGGSLAMKMTQPGKQGKGGIWTVESVQTYFLRVSVVDAKQMVAKGPMQDHEEIVLEGICPDEKDVWYQFATVEDGVQKYYEVSADTGLPREYTTSDGRHTHSDARLPSSAEWEGTYYLGQYEAPSIPLTITRPAYLPDVLFYQYGTDDDPHEAVISANAAYDAENNVTLTSYQNGVVVSILFERDHGMAYREGSGYYGEETQPFGKAAELSGWPTPYSNNVTKGYGLYVYPVTRERKAHTGVDIAAPGGSPVLAAGDGVVVYSDYSETGGEYILISHGGARLTGYAHMNTRNVKKGDRVQAGQQIGTVGSTGDAADNHLHFEVYEGGHAVSPMEYFQ